MGAEPQVEVNEALDPIDIAYQELEADVLPLDVLREVLTDEGSDDS